MGLYTPSHGKFHDRGYFDILNGINSIDIMGYCTLEDRVTKSHGKYHVLQPRS